MTKKIDLQSAPKRRGSRYPAPFDVPCRDRVRIAVGRSHGLTQFGVNVLRIPPGAWSSQRHWHTHEDEFVRVLEGEVVLVTDAGEELFRAGDMAAFPAGAPQGHHFQNRSQQDAVLLEVGTSNEAADVTNYSDVDLRADHSGYQHRDGTPYPPQP